MRNWDIVLYFKPSFTGISVAFLTFAYRFRSLLQYFHMLRVSSFGYCYGIVIIGVMALFSNMALLWCYNRCLTETKYGAIITRSHQRRKLSYFGHIKRHQSIKKEILEGKVDGKRGRCRPPRRWEDVKAWTKMDLSTCTRAVEKRDVWREVT